DECITVAEILDRRDIRLDAHFMGTCFLTGIAHTRAIIHPALARHAIGARQQTLQQRGLAALKRANDGDEPWPDDPIAVKSRRIILAAPSLAWRPGRRGAGRFVIVTIVSVLRLERKPETPRRAGARHAGIQWSPRHARCQPSMVASVRHFKDPTSV